MCLRCWAAVWPLRPTTFDIYVPFLGRSRPRLRANLAMCWQIWGRLSISRLRVVILGDFDQFQLQSADAQTNMFSLKFDSAVSDEDLDPRAVWVV